VNDLAFSTLNLPPAQLGNLDNLGYKQMTDIQAAALPPGLAGKDLIAQAKTGSGKTAAFALPLLTKLNPRDFGTQALILCPTRELASQVAGEVRRLARYQQNIKVVVLCGGQSIGPQIGSLEHGAHIVVGTPGRIKDHLRKQTLSLGRVGTLVLDEADRMLEMGFIDDISTIIKQTPGMRQTLLFSATYPDDIRALSSRFQRSPEQVSVDALVANSQIDQQFYICQRKDKLSGLEKLLGHFRPDSAVVFCSTKESTREVCAQLNRSGIAALVLNGDLEQRDRDQVLVQFRHLSCRVLVATDVAARGLDIDGLSAVINFDMPRDPETYVHRIGRTGRADRNGLALTLFADTERFKLDAIFAYQNRELALEALQTLPNNNGLLPEPAFATLAIAAGRKDKVRPGDILGALTGDGGIAGSAVGKIDVMDFAAYVAIDRKSAGQALNRLANGKIKGRKFKVRKLQGQPR
jgi:ATP-independent RNA helicase DbpA